jgi:hypothetical protein
MRSLPTLDFSLLNNRVQQEDVIISPPRERRSIFQRVGTDFANFLNSTVYIIRIYIVPISFVAADVAITHIRYTQYIQSIINRLHEVQIENQHLTDDIAAINQGNRNQAVDRHYRQMIGGVPSRRDNTRSLR